MTIIKKSLFRTGFVFLLCGTLLFSGCKKSDSNSQSAANETAKSLSEIVTAMKDSQTDLTNTEMIEQSSSDFADFYENRYGQTYTDGSFEAAIAYSTEASADELSVFHLLSGSDSTTNRSADDFANTLKTYLNDRCVSFNGYAPLEVAKLQNGLVLINGDYVAVIVCNDTAAAKEAFDSSFTNSETKSAESDETSKDSSIAIIGGSDGPTSIFIAGKETNDSDANDSDHTDPVNGSGASDITAAPDGSENTDSNGSDSSSGSGSSTIAADAFEPGDDLKAIATTMYDNSNIVAAYRAGDASTLTDEKQKAIYEKCVDVIAKNITEGMTDIEKETAIHDFMITWADYDEEALKNEKFPSKDANNPYGFLIKQYGICSGYTSTFQLFMDLLDIPCLSIAGSSIFSGSGHAEDHAWNIVQIDGSWYYVDVTWDDPNGAGSDYIGTTFLNCPTATMQMTGHDWNKELYPLVKNYYN